MSPDSSRMIHCLSVNIQNTMTGSQMTLSKSVNIENYEIINVMGKGIHSTVYLGKNLSTGNFYALKESKKNVNSSKKKKNNSALINEANIISKLDHPNIIKCFDILNHLDLVVVVLEFINGGELFKYLSENNISNENECRFFAKQIIQGIEYLHSNNIVHLDLKPENILLRDTESKRLVIVDFSLSRVILPSDSIMMIHGTFEFAAPEIFNYNAIGFYTDMWAFGVILYLLCTGLSPFLGQNDMETQSNICSGNVPLDAPELENVSFHAIDMIRRLLVLDPKKRLTSKQCLSHTWLNTKRFQRPKAMTSIDTTTLLNYVSSEKWIKSIIQTNVFSESSYPFKVQDENTVPKYISGHRLSTRTRSF